MTAPRRTAIAAIAAALALSPATARAQNGAGDEQYSDPFSGQTTQTKPKAQSTPAPAQATPATPQAAAPSAPAQTQAQTPAPAAATGAQLPRTGYDVLPLALLGVVLLGAGVALLRRRGADAGR